MSYIRQRGLNRGPPRGKLMRRIGKSVMHALLIAAASLAVASPVVAAWYGPGPGAYGPGSRGPRANFGPGWTGGRWVNGWHGPRHGWWWTVDDTWYPYPRPVYPYPTYVSAPLEEYNAPSSAQGYAQGVPRGIPYWYFCDNPRGYYPYVQDCENWRELQAPSYGPPPRNGTPPPEGDDSRDRQ